MALYSVSLNYLRPSGQLLALLFLFSRASVAVVMGEDSNLSSISPTCGEARLFTPNLFVDLWSRVKE